MKLGATFFPNDPRPLNRFTWSPKSVRKVQSISSFDQKPFHQTSRVLYPLVNPPTFAPPLNSFIISPRLSSYTHATHPTKYVWQFRPQSLLCKGTLSRTLPVVYT